MLHRVMALVGSLVIASTALAQGYIPKADIHIKREGGASFKITGKNTYGDVDVLIEDKHMFQGFKATGKNGEMTVDINIKSAGLGAGWKLEGKIGDQIVDVRAKQTAPFGPWKVEGKVVDRRVEAEVDDEWDIDPAAAAVFVVFDCCEEKKEK